MYKKIEHYIAHHDLLPVGTKVIIGLSGGPDSVFLLHFLAPLHHTKTISLIAAHLDHEWRPTSSQEEQFCRQLCQQLDIPFVSAKRTELAHTIIPNGSQEDYGRKVRRFFFEKILHEHNADRIALAHHLQDQEETFFIRLIRGSSLTGLTAMKPRQRIKKPTPLTTNPLVLPAEVLTKAGSKDNAYIRPLLETNKADILSWLGVGNHAYVIDESNESPMYLRNRIRTTLTALRNSDTRFDNNFLSTLHHLQETESFLEKHTHAKFTAITEYLEGRTTLNCTQFLVLDPVIRYRILIHWLIVEQVPFYPTHAFLNEIVRFFEYGNGGTHAIHETWSIIKKQSKACIIKL